MAVKDLEVFLQERARSFDENLDLSSGSPFDTEVVQPTLRRIGTDPFSVDLPVFIQSRLQQAFPELATDEGDALTDLLIKTTTLLFDPLVRETFRVKQGLSFKDPTILTTEEAEALGANLFSEREKGALSRGTARIYFSQPRTISCSPINFFTSKGGLHFFPKGLQSITLEEMLLNLEVSLYYFDVNVEAEQSGGQYDIGPNELVTVANIEATVRVTNIRRFKSGVDEETAEEFIGRSQQELTERSMVSLRGIGAQLTKAFPEITRLGVVGFGDPEMQRDVLKGGGLGNILSSGNNLNADLDGDGKPLTKRLVLNPVSGIDFISLIGPPGAAAPGFVLTLFGGFTDPPFARDLDVSRVVSSTVIEVEEQVINPFALSIVWTLRKRELTISDIPGGILFPDSANGTVDIPDGQVHIGGAYDIHVRGPSFDEASVVIENLSDDVPGASGTELSFSGTGEVSIGDLVLGTDYARNDPTFRLFQEARNVGFTLQVLDGPNAGNYRVVGVTQVDGASPILDLDVSTTAISGIYRWRLVDILEVDLVEPKETRVTGSDLETVQNVSVVQTTGSTNFTDLGVSVQDTLRIHNGPDAGDYEIKSVPAFNQAELDRPLTRSASGLSYSIFRANADGGVLLPLIRITSIDLLDTSGQPVGSKIPYAKPIDIQSRAFQNPGRGVKVDILDARLGIVTNAEFSVGVGFPVGGLTLNTLLIDDVTGLTPIIITFPSSPFNQSTAQIVTAINAQASAALGTNTRFAEVVNGNRVGIIPIRQLVAASGGTAHAALFGDTTLRTSADIRSDTIESLSNNWQSISPAINEDNLDVAQVLDGNQIGFYGHLYMSHSQLPGYTGLFSGGPTKDSILLGASRFAPEVGRHVQIGARSLGSVRCFFLEPTSVEFTQDSIFSTTLEDGSLVRFFPDPTVDVIRIPPPPSTALPKDGQSTDGSTTFTVTDPSQNFILSSILPNDELVILYVPITGSAVLADPVPSLAFKSIVLSIDGRPDQTITFVNDLPGFPNDVSRSGAIDQINDALGVSIAKLTGSNHLELETDATVVIRFNGTANSILGFSTSNDLNNASSHAGRYSISSVQDDQLILVVAPNAIPPVGTISRQSFRVERPGSQRLASTQMNGNKAEAGLYYFDVELVSEGTGDLWNIPSDLQLDAEGYRSDGYFLSTDNPNLSFSLVEEPKLHISRTILEVGVSDDPNNATQISGQNIAVNYDRSVLTSDAQNFASSDTERVVNANPLARHLIPHFVRFDLEYIGGSRSDVVLADVEDYINQVYPGDKLESSDLQGIVYRRGAISVKNPIDLIAIVHYPDRAVKAQRSQDGLNTGRLAAFIPDLLNITRSSG